MPNDRWEFSQDVLSKAQRYYENNKVLMDDGGVFWVVGSARKPYRVQTDFNWDNGQLRWVSCSCLHGGNTSAGRAKCSHVVAVLLMLRDLQDADNRFVLKHKGT